MAWLTQGELESRLGAKRLAQLTNDDGGDEPDPVILADVIQDSEAEVLGWVGAIYDPNQLGDTPKLLLAIATKVFEYNAWRRRTRTKVPEAVKADYEMARKDLKAIRRGDMSLGVNPSPPQHPAKGAILQTTERRFSRSSLKGF